MEKLVESCAGSLFVVDRLATPAAAVPTFKLEPDDQSLLRAAYDAKLQEKAMSLYSPDDLVLTAVFPLGQTLGDGEGFCPTALGHEQWFSPAAPHNLSQYVVCRAGHSDYWGWNKETLEQAKDAKARIHDFLYFKGTIDRAVCERKTPERAGAPVGLKSPNDGHGFLRGSLAI